MVIGKMQEVRDQRHVLLNQFQEEIDREDKEAEAAGQDDTDVLRGGSEVDIDAAVKIKLNDRYGRLVNIFTEF